MPVSMLQSVKQNVRKDIQILPTRLLNLVPTGLILTTRNISTFAFDVQAGINNFTVNWGDGTSTSHTGSARVTKNYAGAGVYGITIDGVFTGFNNSSIVAPIASISSWGVSKFTSALDAFVDSISLTALPSSSLDNFILATNLQSAWAGCIGLTSFPLINASAATNLQSAWAFCTALLSFPLIDTAAGTNFRSAWDNCRVLTSFPLINTSAGTNFQSTWASCRALLSFPLINTSAGTNFSFAWADCRALTSFPAINTAAGTNFEAAWDNCIGLTSFPLINVSAGTNFAFAWASCTALTSFPANMFDSCLATNFNGAWLNSSNLTQTSVDNIVISINTANQSNGTLRVDGVTPSTAGRTAVDALRARGWTVTVTGY